MAQFLIQEDDSEFAHQLALALASRQHQAIICHDADQSAASLSENAIDAMIVDVFVRESGVLKPRGGLYLLGLLQQAKLRRQPVGLIPVMVITGAPTSHSGIDVLDQAIAMGAVCTLRKPFSIPVFLDSAESLLGSSVTPGAA